MNENQKIIDALRRKISDIEALARREGRQLSNVEKGLIEEMKAELHDRLSLPATAPQTIQDFGASKRSSGPFANLGEQLRAVAQAGIPGGKTDPRLFQAASGLNETVPSDGGFLVQQDFSRELLKSAFETGFLAKLCRRIQISGNSNGIKINAFDETSRISTRFGGIVGYWASEAEEKTKSKPKFRQLELNLKKLIGLCYASDELLADANVMNSVLPAAFASEFGFRIDDAIINGTGAGQPLGILNAGSLVVVEKETGQVAATIMAENVIKMFCRQLNPGSAVWLVSKSIFPELWTMSLAIGTGGAPVFQPAGGLSALPYSTLLGRPVIPVEQCATLGTVGDIIFADLEGGYVLAEKGGLQTDVSIHVRFIYDESDFRFVYRVDGQPVLASPIAAYKGGAANSQSHFVALETRS